jgi:hypothetical protein
MADALKTAFYRKLEAVQSSGSPGERDPRARDDLFEALGLAVVLRVTGELDDLPLDDRRELLRIGRREVLAARAEDEDDAYAIEIARAGVHALSGKHEFDSRLGDRSSPPPARLLGMLRGEPDGLSAAACAIRVASSAADREKLAVLSLAEAPAVLRVAAQEEEPVRDPASGRRVGVLRGAEIEAILFGDRELALYAAADHVIRVEAEGVVTQQMLPGYWLGRLPSGADRVQAVIELGEERIEWNIDLA